MNTKKYEAFYNNQKKEFEANDLYAAKLKAIDLFNIPKSKEGLLAVELKDSNNFMYY